MNRRERLARAVRMLCNLPVLVPLGPVLMPALMLVVPSLAFAGDPARIPNSYDRPQFVVPPELASPDFTPPVLQRLHPTAPLAMGPVGQFATLSLPETQSEF